MFVLSCGRRTEEGDGADRRCGWSCGRRGLLIGEARIGLVEVMNGVVGFERKGRLEEGML